MEQVDVVASLGQMQLLRPAWIKAALAAKDRLKLYLTVLQAVQSHAEQPSAPPLDLTREFAAAQVNTSWLTNLPGTAFCVGKRTFLPSQGSATTRRILRVDTAVEAFKYVKQTCAKLLPAHCPHH